MDARPSGGGAEEIFGCNEKVGVPEFLTGTSPGGLGIARTPERTSPIRRPPLDTCGRAGRTPQPGSPAQCCVAGRSGHFLGNVQILFFGLQRSQIEPFSFLPKISSCVSTKPKRRCLGKRSPPRRHPQPPRGRHHPHDPRQEVAKPNSYTLQHDHHRFRIIRSATRRHPRGRGRDGPAVRIREARTACPNQTDVPTRQSLRFLQRLRRQRVFQVQGQVPKGDAVASRGAEGQARAEGEWFAELQMRSS